MTDNRAIPKGFMTVGQLAKKAGTTVRTLQYYDRQGILRPTAESEGGRRLYTDKDMVRLHQIRSLKSLGFSLDEIKNRLASLDSPEDVAAALTDHAAAIRKQMNELAEALAAVETLKTEVLQMQSVDFGKYADIIVSLQMKNEMYWAIKHFDQDTLDYMRNNFNGESSRRLIETHRRISDQAIKYMKEGVDPESSKGQALAVEFWEMLMEFTGGDMGLLNKLQAFTDNTQGLNEDWVEKQSLVKSFIESALCVYFDNMETMT